MHNLAEEHGYCETGFRPEQAHDCTFRAFLASLGTEPAPEGPAVRAFNLALYGACALEAPQLGLAALAMIEYAFADISARIGATVVQRGWVPSDELVHYSLHAELDLQHSAELFETVEGAAAELVEAGLALGWHIFAQLYRALL
jgi:pyrroloquinoline-quinone synthase